MTSNPDAAARSAAGRALQRPQRRRRPPEDLRVVVPLDARTKPGRAANQLKAALLRHLGAKASAAQLAIAQQCVQLKLRLVALDQRFLEAGGNQSEHDARQYLAWNNSFVRALRTLGLVGADDPTVSLADYLATKRPVPAPQATASALAAPAVTTAPAPFAPASPAADAPEEDAE